MFYGHLRWKGLAWILANVLGLVGGGLAGMLAGVLAVVLARIVVAEQPANILGVIVGMAVTGAVLGWAQRLALRSNLPELVGWTRAGAIAGVVAGAALILIFWLVFPNTDALVVLSNFPGEAGTVAGAVAGSALGVAQWLILRRYVRRAGWLIPAVVAGMTISLAAGAIVNTGIRSPQIGGDFFGPWTILLLFVFLSWKILVIGLMAGVVSGALTGIALAFLLPAQLGPARPAWHWLGVSLSIVIVLVIAGPVIVNWYRGRSERTLLIGEHALGIAFSPDGQTFATSANDGTIKLWRVSDGTFLQAFTGHRSYVETIAFSPDGLLLAGGGGLSGSTIKLWRVADSALLKTFSGHDHGTGVVAFSPDGQILGSAGNDNTIKLWRVSDGALLHTFSHDDKRLWGVTFSPDGQTLAAGSADGVVTFWQISDGTVTQTLKGSSHEIGNVTFSPDGQLLASGAYQAVQLWRVRDGTPLWKQPVNPGPATLLGYLESGVGTWDAVFSPDGQTLATITGGGTATYDGTARLWRVSDGTLLRTFEDDPSAQDIAFAPDGKLLAIADWDGVVKFWRVAP